MNPDFPKTPREELEAKLTALLLGELPDEEAAALRHTIEQDAELAGLYERLKQTIELVRETAASPNEETTEQTEALKLSEERREKLLAHFKTVAPKEFARPRRREMPWYVPMSAAAILVFLIGGVALLPDLRPRFELMAVRGEEARLSLPPAAVSVTPLTGEPLPEGEALAFAPAEKSPAKGGGDATTPVPAQKEGGVYAQNIVGYVNLPADVQRKLVESKPIATATPATPAAPDATALRFSRAPMPSGSELASVPPEHSTATKPGELATGITRQDLSDFAAVRDRNLFSLQSSPPAPASAAPPVSSAGRMEIVLPHDDKSVEAVKEMAPIAYWRLGESGQPVLPPTESPAMNLAKSFVEGSSANQNSLRPSGGDVTHTAGKTAGESTLTVNGITRPSANKDEISSDNGLASGSNFYGGAYVSGGFGGGGRVGGGGGGGGRGGGGFGGRRGNATGSGQQQSANGAVGSATIQVDPNSRNLVINTDEATTRSITNAIASLDRADQVPALGDLPVLGTLFRSESKVADNNGRSKPGNAASTLQAPVPTTLNRYADTSNQLGFSANLHWDDQADLGHAFNWSKNDEVNLNGTIVAHSGTLDQDALSKDLGVTGASGGAVAQSNLPNVPGVYANPQDITKALQSLSPQDHAARIPQSVDRYSELTTRQQQEVAAPAFTGSATSKIPAPEARRAIVLPQATPDSAARSVASTDKLVLQDEKTKANTLVQDGRLLFEMGRIDEAEAKLKLASNADPENNAAKYYLGLVEEGRNAVTC